MRYSLQTECVTYTHASSNDNNDIFIERINTTEWSCRSLIT